MIKIIFFDIDGTLRPFETGIIPEDSKAAVRRAREAGVLCAIATGRHWVEIYNEGLVEDMYFDAFVTLDGGYDYILHPEKARPVFQKQGAKKPKDYHFLIDEAGLPLPYFDPKNGEVLLQEAIHGEMVENVLAMAEEESFPILFLEERRLYANFVNDALLHCLSEIKSGIPPILPLSEARKNPLYMLIPVLNEAQVEELERRIPDCHLVRWSDGLSFDVTKRNISKVSGIEAICKALGIQREECAAIGDGWNDVEMLSHVGMGIAMGNAKEECKAVANYITAPILEGGLPQAVDYILNYNETQKK